MTTEENRESPVVADWHNVEGDTEKGIKMKKNKLVHTILLGIILTAFCVNLFSADVTADTPEDSAVSNNPYTPTEIKLIVAAIDPTLTSTTGKHFGNGEDSIAASEYLRFSLDESVNFWCDNIEEMSNQTVNVKVVDTVIIDEFPQYITGESLDNESFQEIFKRDKDGYGMWYEGITSDEYKPYDTWGDLDYKYYIDKLDLVNRRNAGEFNMVMLLGIDPLSPYETCIVGNKPFWINGEGIEADCENFVIVTPTFSRQDGSLENIGHLAENMLGYIYGPIDYTPGSMDGSDYEALNDWQKYCLCKYLATPDTEVYGYGTVHFAPNSESDYDWENDTPVKYYKDWKNGKDIQEFTASGEYLTKPEYFHDNSEVAHIRWWFSNMPCKSGRDENGYYNNWWKYIFTPDYVTELHWAESTGHYVQVIEVGEEFAYPFHVKYFSGKELDTDTVLSEAVIVSKDESVVEVKGNAIIGKAPGYASLEIRIDGKTLNCEVCVGDPSEIINSKLENDLPSDSFPDVKPISENNSSTGAASNKTSNIVMIVIGSVLLTAVIVIDAIGIVKWKRRK